MTAILLVFAPGYSSLAQQENGEENPYALCGGTREACDPFSYLNDDFAIPDRGDYVQVRRSGYSGYSGPWGSYRWPYGYWPPPAYIGPPGPWLPRRPPWPIPVPYRGPFFHPPVTQGFTGFFGSVNSHGGGFFFGFGYPVFPPYHPGVQPVPRPDYHYGFGNGQPAGMPRAYPGMTSPGTMPPSFQGNIRPGYTGPGSR